MTAVQQQRPADERFQFGLNWQQFLTSLNDQRILEAEESLKTMLGVNDLTHKTFLDIGSGSGLFSLAARRLGAKVYSFDYDAQSVAATATLKQHHCPHDEDWIITQGSALDPVYLQTLGQFDVVYSWGVLHHTGAMWQALANVIPLVQQDGQLFIAIYNDQGIVSRRWRQLKRVYNRLPRFLQKPFVILAVLPSELPFFLRSLLRLRLRRYFDSWRHYRSGRGMSKWHDMVDWVGGYPFEVAKPEEIFDFYYAHGFSLTKLKTCGAGQGCNEFVFKRNT